MPEANQGRPAPKSSLEQSYIVLGVVALVSLGLGLWQLRTSIRLPFAPAVNNSTTTPAADSLANLSADSSTSDIEALKNRDTDGDDLSDYDETYLYHTSPYLKDTDSDGYDDKTEVVSGNDPNCPAGKTCTPANIPAGSPDSTPAPANTPTPAEIRATLKKSGATDETLQQYDDATLLQLYREVAGENTPATTVQPKDNVAAPPSSNSPSLTLEQQSLIKGMTGAQLRQFLVQGGADKTLLDRFDDATLKVIVNQALGL